METQPLISIVTVTYNAGETLLPTLESVNSQEFTDFEHIIVDGASKDNTIEIASKFSSSRLRIISEPDKGLYDAMNKGLRLARGQYILFLNAGDSFHSPLTLLIYARGAASGADIVYADTVIVDKERSFLRPRHLSAPAVLTHNSFSNGMLVCHQAFMVRLSLAPFYDTQYRLSADYDWTVKCIMATSPDRCLNLNMVAIDYLSDGMTDKNKLKSLKERFHIMSKHYGFSKTVLKHISFVFRALNRRLKNN